MNSAQTTSLLLSFLKERRFFEILFLAINLWLYFYSCQTRPICQLSHSVVVSFSIWISSLFRPRFLNDSKSYFFAVTNVTDVYQGWFEPICVWAVVRMVCGMGRPGTLELSRFSLWLEVLEVVLWYGYGYQIEISWFSDSRIHGNIVTKPRIITVLQYYI